MTNEEILKKAIEKAVDNGWKYKYNNTGYLLYEIAVNEFDYGERLHGLLFDPEWARCFWKGTEWEDRWKGRQITILAKIQKGQDPIQYLRQYVD